MFRKNIKNYLHTHKNLRFINTKYITIALIFSLVIIVFIAISSPGSAKKKYTDISNFYNDMRKPEKQERPHAWFDINTYSDSNEFN